MSGGVLRLFTYLFETYGLDVLQLGVICYFGWKMLTNHFKHIQDDIHSIKISNDNINSEIKGLRERVSRIEGQLSN